MNVISVDMTTLEQEAIDYLREYAREGCPRRADGSFPTDFLTSMRRLMAVPASISGRRLEHALEAGPDFDTRLGRDRWSWNETKRFKEDMG